MSSNKNHKHLMSVWLKQVRFPDSQPNATNNFFLYVCHKSAPRQPHACFFFSFFSRIKTISTNLWKCIMNQVPQFGRTVDALHSHSLQWTTMHEVEGERRSNVNRWFIRYGLCKWFFLLLFFCGRIKWMNPFRRKFIRVLLIQHRFQVEQKSGEIARCIKYKVLIQMNIYTR